MTITLPPQSYIGWSVGVTVLHILAGASTVFRVSVRYRTSRMWWDDYLVIVPTLVNAFFCVTLWTNPIYPRGQGTTSRHINYWFSLFLAFTIVWFSRICLVISLARIFPRWHLFRIVSIALSVVFALTYVACVLSTALHCAIAIPPSQSSKFTRCVRIGGNGAAGLFGYIADALGDVSLVVAPLYMLWRIKLPPREKRMILVTFSSSALTLMVVSVFILFSYGPFTKNTALFIIVPMIGHIEAAISLLSCNLLVVVSAIFRLIRRLNSTEQASPTPASTSLPTDTVEKSSSALPESRFSEPTNTEESTYTTLTKISTQMFPSDFAGDHDSQAGNAISMDYPYSQRFSTQDPSFLRTV